MGYDRLKIDDTQDSPDALGGQNTPDALSNFAGEADALANVDAGPVGDTQTECDSASPEGLFAQWLANGNLDNAVTCPALRLEAAGNVPYLQGVSGQAWSFRSEHTSDDGDPDYLRLAQPSALSLRSFTMDAWVRQTGMNNFAGSNRFVVGTNFAEAFRTPQAMIYVHQNGWTFLYVRTGNGDVRGTDWATCDFRNLSEGTWTRVTGTHDGLWLRCYLNGVIRSSTELPIIESFPMRDFAIGRSYPGDIDGVRIFQRALSDPEVATPWP